MNIRDNELEVRTKRFALRVIKFVSDLPKTKVADVLGYQFLKSGTSIGTNYREARRAESTDDFIHKIGLVEKETNESKYWLKLFDETGIDEFRERVLMLKKVSELLAIFTSSGKTAKANRKKASADRESRTAKV